MNEALLVSGGVNEAKARTAFVAIPRLRTLAHVDRHRRSVGTVRVEQGARNASPERVDAPQPTDVLDGDAFPARSQEAEGLADSRSTTREPHPSDRG